MGFVVEASNCDTIRIEVGYPHLSACKANAVFCLLVASFRDVKITSHETGEVMRSAYWSDEFFSKDMPEDECLRSVREYLNSY